MYQWSITPQLKVELPGYHPTPCLGICGLMFCKSSPCSGNCIHICNNLVVSRKYCFTVVIYWILLLQVFCPFSAVIPKLLNEGMLYGCPMYGWVLSNLVFIDSWWVVDLHVHCHLQQMEASLVRVERYMDLWVYQQVYRSCLILYLLNRIIVVGYFLGLKTYLTPILDLINNTRHEYCLVNQAINSMCKKKKQNEISSHSVALAILVFTV